MRVDCRVFFMQKSGCSVEEYEDAFSPRTEVQEDLDRFSCAVADGASETSFSGPWAQLLADAFVSGDIDLPSLREAWQSQIAGLELPWYAAEKAALGAFAALAGVTFTSAPDDSKTGSWQCTAFGDCCLFQVRGREILRSFPLEKWQQFKTSPFLIGSMPPQSGETEPVFAQASGTWLAGDCFLLMSDAIACWFLRRQDEASDAIETVLGIKDGAALRALVEEQRLAKGDDGRPLMRNDDVTLMRVTFPNRRI